jgi:hypothetical protein
MFYLPHPREFVLSCYYRAIAGARLSNFDHALRTQMRVTSIVADLL